MTAPRPPLSPASHRPESPTPCRSGIAQPARGVGAAASFHLTDAEMDALVADIDPRWTGMTGLAVPPEPEMLRVLIDRTMRKAREMIAARPDKDFC